MIVALAGCRLAPGGTDRGPGTGAQPLPPPTRAQAEAFLDDFMTRRAAGQPVDAFLAAGVQVRPSLSTPRLILYAIAPDEDAFRVRSTWSNGPLGATLLTERLSVSATPAGLRVSGAEVVAEESVLVEDDHVLIRRSAAESVLLDTAVHLPNEVQPYGADPEVKFGVSRPLTLLALALDGRVAFFTGREVHGGLGMVRDGPDDLRMLDVLFESDGLELAWSPDGRYLATIVRTPKPSHRVLVWDSQDWSRQEIEGAGEDAAGLRWTGIGLHFTAAGTPYTWDPATGKLERQS